MNNPRQRKNYYYFLIAGIVVIAVALIASLTFTGDEDSLAPNNEQRFEIVEEEFENSENLKLLPQRNLNKDTTQQPFLGFPVDSFNQIIKAKNSQEKFSIRFTSKFSGSISSILLPMKTNLGDEVKVGLQESIRGYPSGDWLGNSTAHSFPLVMPSTKVLETNFTQNIPIQSGKTYHIVIEPTLKNNDEPFWLRVYTDNWSINSLNHTDPDETWKDPSIGTLFFDGKNWEETGNWPIFVIKYSNGISDGQPYSLFAPWIIGEQRYVGQAVIPYSTYKVDKISFVVGTKGDPPDDLFYAIFDSENNNIADGLFVKQGEITRRPSWLSQNLFPSLTFEAGKLYRVVLYSPESTLKNGYFVYGHEYMLDKTLGYGSTTHHLTASFNGLKSWIEWYDADAAFKFINSN